MADDRLKPLKERVDQAEKRPVLTEPIYAAFRTDGVKPEEPKVKVAGTTTGPQRVTITVPCPGEETKLHLGAAGKDLPSGIYAESAKHIHWETETTPKTLVSLGESPKDFKIENRATLGNVPRGLEGYCMGTEGTGYHYATGSTTITSATGDAVMHSALGDAFFQSAGGIAHVKAAKDIVFRARSATVGAASFTPEAPTYETTYATTSTEGLGSVVSGSTVPGWGDVVESCGQLIPMLLPPIKQGKAGVRAWATTGNLAEFGVALAKIAASVYGIFADIPSGTLVAKGNVGMSALNVGMSGGIASGIGANYAAGMASAVASVVGGAYAALFGALEACVQSANRTMVWSKTSSVSLAAGRSGSVNGGSSVQIAGNGNVQLDGGSTSVYGKAGVFVGAGGDFGLLVATDSVSIRELAIGQSLDPAADDGKPHVSVSDGKFVAKAHGREVILEGPHKLSYDGSNYYEWSNAFLTAKGAKIDLN